MTRVHDSRDLDGDVAGSLDAAAWVAAVSHDLREPMNAILGMARLLLQTRLDPTQRQHAETIEDAAAGMVTLVNDLMDFSRLERGELRILDEPFDLARLLARCVEMVRPRAASAALDLALTCDPTTPAWVRGDAGRLRQILVNLLVNALKSTLKGSVRLEVSPVAPGRLRFAVVDTGPGFAPGDVDRLFGAPDHASPATARSGGLGLSIVRLLVARIGGAITVTSVPGEGARVTVELPLPEVAAVAPARRVPIAGRLVWLVGGSDAIRVSMAGALGTAGLDVRSMDEAAFVAAAALEGGEPPDALLLATSTPDAAAARIALTLKTRWPDLVLLAVAGSGLRGEGQAWRQGGFHGYLPHPASADVVTDALSVLLGARANDQPFVTVHSLADQSVGSLDVLVVDDNPLNVKLVVIILERAGHRVEVAEEGAAAVRRVAAGGIDAVLMDVQMPGMDGLEATRRIRAMVGDAASTPIIAVTANAMQSHLDACRTAGMDDVVTKPIEAASLLAALADAVAAATRSNARR